MTEIYFLTVLDSRKFRMKPLVDSVFGENSHFLLYSKAKLYLTRIVTAA